MLNFKSKGKQKSWFISTQRGWLANYFHFSLSTFSETKQPFCQTQDSFFSLKFFFFFFEIVLFSSLLKLKLLTQFFFFCNTTQDLLLLLHSHVDHKLHLLNYLTEHLLWLLDRSTYLTSCFFQASLFLGCVFVLLYSNAFTT